MSDKPRPHRYSLFEQADIVAAVVAAETPGPVMLIAHLLISYLDERERCADRWHGAVRDWPKPLSFLWALDDPVATTNVLDGLPELRPAADVVEFPGIGTTRRWEVPEIVTRAALSLLTTASH